MDAVLQVQTPEKFYTSDEFWDITALPENQDKRLELKYGRIVEMPPPQPENSRIAMLIGSVLTVFTLENNLGHVLGADGGYILSPGNVRVPDVSFVSIRRFPKLPLPKKIQGGPDLAVEVISPGESSHDVIEKVSLYLESGTHLVCGVYPEAQEIYGHRLAPEGEMRVQKMDINAILDGGDVLPGFKLPVKKIFPPELFGTKTSE